MVNTTLIDTLEENWDLLAKSTDKNMLPAMKLLYDHLKNPRSYVTLTGETSSGKSTLINAFLKKKFLLAKAKPTTGTVTWIDYGNSEEENFYAINKDASIDDITYPTFLSLLEKPDEDLLRLKASLPCDNNDFKGMNIFDTPGFNSIISEHAEVLKEFLPESDVILFLASYRVGFGNSDQQLMNLIYDIGVKFGQIPVLLVINRVPHGINENDKRIKEIRSHAEDSLHNKVKLLIVNTSTPDENGNSTLPDADHVWQETAAIAFSKERQEALFSKLKEILISLFEQRIGEINGYFAVKEAGHEGIQAIQENFHKMEGNEALAFQIVDKYLVRLEKKLPSILINGIEQIKLRIANEIENSSKWKEKYACQTFIIEHVIPFETSKVLNTIDDYVLQQLEEMDKELEEMANTTLFSLNNEINQISKPEIKQLLTNLSLKITKHLIGKSTNKLLCNMGGACGKAAGAGNLAKKTVSKVGKFFHIKFKQDVYNKIGKIFTKKAIQKMGILLDVGIEIASYASDSMTWQKKLRNESYKNIDEWQKEALRAISTSMIPAIKKENYENVKAVYDELKDEIKQQIADAHKQNNNNEINQLRGEKQVLLDAVKKLENKYV